MSCVMLSFTWVDEIFPPQRPAWLLTPPSLVRGIPSRYQFSLTGGLLELESQNRLASVPTVSARGSMRIFSVSGRTGKSVKKSSVSSFSVRSRGRNHHDGQRGEKKEIKAKKKFLLFPKNKEIQQLCQLHTEAEDGAATDTEKKMSERFFNQILKIFAFVWRGETHRKSFFSAPRENEIEKL